MTKMNKIVPIIIAYVFLFAVMPCYAEITAVDYYVATTGTDAVGNGTLDKPFKTIQYAANQMKAGDTCYIRGGVYRETVTPFVSGNESEPVKFAAYSGENVVISGGQLLSGWELYKGNIYKAKLNMSFGEKNMVYASGTLMHEARWPNSNDPLDSSTYATVDSFSDSKLTDAGMNIPSASNFYDGAVVWATSVGGYVSKLAQVTYYNSTAHSLSITGNTDIGAGSLYYITRSLDLLDAENEWYIDSYGNIYFYAPGGVNPGTIEVETKVRNYGFDIAGKSYITIDGIDFRGVNINTDAATAGCMVKNGDFNGIDYNMPPTGNPRATGLNVS